MIIFNKKNYTFPFNIYLTHNISSRQKKKHNISYYLLGHLNISYNSLLVLPSHFNFHSIYLIPLYT